jgi:hypothetical protein
MHIFTVANFYNPNRRPEQNTACDSAPGKNGIVPNRSVFHSRAVEDLATDYEYGREFFLNTVLEYSRGLFVRVFKTVYIRPYFFQPSDHFIIADQMFPGPLFKWGRVFGIL